MMHCKPFDVSPYNLEIHVSHACNLACQQCTHYSNYKHKGMLSSEDADYQMSLWSGRLRPFSFSLLGGEPTLNPELCSIVLLARKHWPNAKLQLISNGFFLHKHPDLPKVLEETGTHLDISIHHDSQAYQDRLKPVRELISTWKSVKVYWRESSKFWTRTYLGEGSTMQPYDDNDPTASWSCCRAKWCPQIYDGKLWKCPQLAYLRKQLSKFDLEEDPNWKPYLEYKPLSPNCSNLELEEFVTRKVESFCKMCPSSPQMFQLGSPLRGKTENG